MLWGNLRVPSLTATMAWDQEEQHQGKKPGSMLSCSKESLRPPLEHRGEDNMDSANIAPSGADMEAGDNDTVPQ